MSRTPTQACQSRDTMTTKVSTFIHCAEKMPAQRSYPSGPPKITWARSTTVKRAISVAVTRWDNQSRKP